MSNLTGLTIFLALRQTKNNFDEPVALDKRMLTDAFTEKSQKKKTIQYLHNLQRGIK